VHSLVEAAKAGDLSRRITVQGKTGRFRKLSEGINELVDVSERVISDTQRVLGALARGELTETITATYQGAFDQLKRDANATVEKLTQVLSEG
jgi:methyl-accepting chemotaxis protein